MNNHVTFYKAIALKIDLFESNIIDEKHFADIFHARSYTESMIKAGYTTIIITM